MTSYFNKMVSVLPSMWRYFKIVKISIWDHHCSSIFDYERIRQFKLISYVFLFGTCLGRTKDDRNPHLCQFFYQQICPFKFSIVYIYKGSINIAENYLLQSRMIHLPIAYTYFLTTKSCGTTTNVTVKFLVVRVISPTNFQDIK